MPHPMYKHLHVYIQESISLLFSKPFFTNVEHCTNTVVKVISQLLTLLPAVSETLCFFTQWEQTYSSFTSDSSLFQAVAKLLLYHDYSVGIKKNKTNEYIYLIKHKAPSRFSVVDEPKHDPDYVTPEQKLLGTLWCPQFSLTYIHLLSSRAFTFHRAQHPLSYLEISAL